jgi:electron transfer flavoprotein beta subunit
MRILVLVKQVPLSSDVAIDEKTGVIKRESGEAKMNPYDLYALETAMQLRAILGGEVIVLTMGPPQAEQVLREAFMMGADDGYLLTDRAFAGSDVLATSYALSQGIQRIGDVDLILCGKQTTDGDTAQVGAECSEFLHIPCVASVQRIITSNESSIVVECDTGSTLEQISIPFPALIGVEKDIYQPRLPSYSKMKQTASRPIHKITVTDLYDTNEDHYGLKGSPTQVQRIFPPEVNQDFVLWDEGDLSVKLFDYLERNKFLQERL